MNYIFRKKQKNSCGEMAVNMSYGPGQVKGTVLSLVPVMLCQLFAYIPGCAGVTWRFAGNSNLPSLPVVMLIRYSR